MFGQINKIRAAIGKRDEVVRFVVSGSEKMPGCQSYIVARDADDIDVIWVTEVWTSADFQEASMDLPAVKASIEQAMPMIVSFDTIATTIPTKSA